MYICICNGITDQQIEEAVKEGVGSMDELQMKLGVGTSCGTCIELASSYLPPFEEPRVAIPNAINLLATDEYSNSASN